MPRKMPHSGESNAIIWQSTKRPMMSECIHDCLGDWAVIRNFFLLEFPLLFTEWGTKSWRVNGPRGLPTPGAAETAAVLPTASLRLMLRTPPRSHRQRRDAPARASRARKRLPHPARPVACAPLKTASGIDTLRVATKTVLTVAAALAFLLFTFISVSSLHEESHQHNGGQSPDHSCVMCALAKSQLTGAEPTPLVTPLAVAAAPSLSPLAVSVELPTSDHPLPPGRAPPVV